MDVYQMLTGYFSSCRLCPMCSCGMYKERAERFTENHRDDSIAPGQEGFESGRCVWYICNSNMVAFKATKLCFSLSSKVLIYFIAHPRPAKLAVRGSETSSRFWASLLLSLLAEDIAYNSLVVLSGSPAYFGSVSVSVSTAYHVPPAQTVEIILPDEMPEGYSRFIVSWA